MEMWSKRRGKKRWKRRLEEWHGAAALCCPASSAASTLRTCAAICVRWRNDEGRARATFRHARSLLRLPPRRSR
jgi:hypothetical protein